MPSGKFESFTSQSRRRSPAGPPLRAPSKSAIEDHAEEWYRQVLGELSGIDKLRVEKKLAGAETQKTKAEAKSGPSIRSLRPGVVGEYFSDIEFEKRVLVRIDPEIDFDWGGGSPDDWIAPDRFGIQWHG